MTMNVRPRASRRPVPLGIIGALSERKAREFIFTFSGYGIRRRGLFPLSPRSHFLKTNILVNGPHILIFIAAFWIAAK